jgi:hypothetical protein
METIRGDKEAVRDQIDAAKAARDRTLVTGLFRDRASAERAYDSLTLRGYRADDVDIVMSDETRRRQFGDGSNSELGVKAAQGAGVGGAIGGAVGAIAAIFAVVGSSVSVPGLGIVVAGPVAAALAGAGAGAAAGGVLRALAAIGVPEDRAVHYEQGIRSGSILMSLKVRDTDDADHVVDDWIANEGQYVYR